LDTLKIKKKQEEENATMIIYCQRCKRRHSSREFPLDNISVCGFCMEGHSTEKCPSFLDFYPSIGVGILGNPLIHLGGHGSLGTNSHTQIHNLKFHPIINNHNSGTHQVGNIGLHSTNILGFKDGKEDITKGTLKLHLSLCPTILTISFH
jgi:hypothetical protein